MKTRPSLGPNTETLEISVAQTSNQLYLIPVKVEDMFAYALLDCGANASWINQKFVHPEAHRTKLDTPVTPRGFSSHSRNPAPVTHSVQLGISIMETRNQPTQSLDTFYIIPELRFDLLLGLDWLQRHEVTMDFARRTVQSSTFGNIPVLGHLSRAELGHNAEAVNVLIKDFTQQQEDDAAWTREIAFDDLDEDAEVTQAELASVPVEFHKYRDVFSKKRSEALPPNREGVDITIVLETDKLHTLPRPRAYKLGIKERDALKTYLDDMLQKGFIRPSSSPFAFPAFFVPKPGSTELRLVVDYKRLNAITVKDKYGLPLIADILDVIAKGKIFTKIDLRGAYNLLRVAQGHEHKTAFITPLGTYEYLVMPFGLSNAPPAFQRWINSIFHDLAYHCVMVYLDDIIIFSDDRDSHHKHVDMVLQRLRSNRLYASPKKCDWYSTNLSYLGHVITPDSVQMAQDKIEAIKSWVPPTSKKGIERFLGFANYYRSFIKSFSHITRPLTHLLRKDVLKQYAVTSDTQHFTLPADAIQAFETLKQAFCTSPILAHWDPSLPTVLETDASSFAIGAILSQKHQTDWKPVAYISQSFSPAELNYDIHDKEMLSIVVAFVRLRHWLLGLDNLVVQTDHKNLEQFMLTKALSPRQIRWAQFLAQFRFQVCYRPGLQNGRCDALSRRDDLATEAYANFAHVPLNMADDKGIRARSRPSAVVHGTMLSPTCHPLLTPNKGGGLGDVENKESPHTVEALHKHGELDINNITQYTRYEQQEDELTSQIKLAQSGIAPNERKSLTQEAGFTIRATSNCTYLFYRDVLYVPNIPELRSKAISVMHDPMERGHPGVKKTIAILHRFYAWPGDRTDVAKYVGSCEECARNKPLRTKRYGPLRPLEPPTTPWQSVTMDRIVQLPPSRGYTAIIVIVDRFTKYAICLPTKESFTSQDLADLFLRQVTYVFGNPKEIISDRGPEFASSLWKTVCTKLGIQRKLSTAYHPETDGQTERLNQTLETYLRFYVSYHQDNWADLLPLAAFCYNSSPHSATGMSPCEGLYAYLPDIGRTHVTELAEEQSRLTAPEIRASILQNLNDAREVAERNFNRHRQPLPDWPVGRKVLLSTRNLRVTRPSRKLGNLYVGPFEILERVSSHAYRLKLDPDMKIHNVFHVAQLREIGENQFANRKQLPPPPVVVEGETEYVVDAIVAQRKRANKTEFRVKWKGYSGHEQFTWEPMENIDNTEAYQIYLDAQDRRIARRRR